mgnify:CR=1 FL=1
MLFIHEMAHVLMALKLGYQVGVIHVYPFGFSAQIYHLDHGQVFEILLILFAGLGMHLLFFPLIQNILRYLTQSKGLLPEDLIHQRQTVLARKLAAGAGAADHGCVWINKINARCVIALAAAGTLPPVIRIIG